LSLPKFYGKLTDWISFWESFSVEIDPHPDLSDINRFDYLYGLLQGMALDTVKSIFPSSANYKVLKETLKDNFGRNRKILRAHVLRLLHLPKAELSGPSLRKLYNAIMTDLRSLATLRVDTNTSASILVPVFEEKLPSRVKGNISEIDREDTFNLSKFLDALKRQVERYEEEYQAVADLGKSKNSALEDTSDVRETTPQSTIGSCASMCSMCAICGSSRHSAFGCNLTLKQKRELVNAKKLCKLCLLPGHFAYRCNSTSRCSTCNGLHHSSLHGVEWRARGGFNRSRSRRRRETDRSSSGVALQATGTSQSLGNSETTSCGFVGENKVVLVKTAKAMADFNGRRIVVRVFIDEGSQRSYLQRKVAQELGKEPMGYVELGISGFHGTYSRERYGKATVGIVTSEGLRNIPVLITEDIVAPISQQGWKSCLELDYLSGLDFADNFQDGKFVVDILIGADTA
jgi:hypothetical protein